MTDTVQATIENIPAPAPAPAPAHEQQKNIKTPAKPTKTKPRRKVTRRRRGTDDEDDDGSASDASESPETPAPVFPSSSSTTPVVWADMVDTPEKGSPVSFDEERGPQASRGRGGATVRGRGRGGKVVRERREFTEEEQKRYEEIKKAKKERQKAKRKELKELKRKEQLGPSSSEAAAAAGESVDSAVDTSLATSTSALKLDDSSPQTATPLPDDAPTPTTEARGLNGTARGGMPAPRGRATHTQDGGEDPKSTPRVGNFWMHDQRHHDNNKPGEGSFSGHRAMPEFWRGRGGARGMPPRGGFRGGPRGRGRGFAHLPFSPQAQAAAAAQAARAAASATNSSRTTDSDKPESEPHRPSASGIDGKWGHEGFEEMNARDEAMRANRAQRGRGRGFGPMRGGMRGGISSKVGHLPTPEASPDRVSSKISEGTSTQPAAEVLLNDSGAGAVTVRLPGETETVAVDARPPSQAAQVEPVPAQSPFPPVFTPSNSSPGPYVASDSSSMSSGGYIAPGMPMHPNVTGEYYGMPPNMASGGRPSFFPSSGSYGQQQSFTPEPSFQPHQQQHHRGSFSGPNAPHFYPNAGSSFAPQSRPRAGSPLNPYAGQMGGFFVPRSSQGVPIRPASGKDAASGSDPKSPSMSEAADSAGRGSFDAGQPGQHDTFVPGYYQYNPYAGGAVDSQGMFYPQQGYWQPQQGYAQGGYGYDGEYQGY